MKRQYTVKSQLTKSPGIYIISCNQTDKVYIGESLNLSQRICKHFSLLRKGSHGNPILQNIYNKYGEDSLAVDVLEYVKTESELELKILEQKYQEKYPTCISFDSNTIYQVERSEEWKANQRKVLDSVREQAIKACQVPIIIYDEKDKSITRFASITEASKVIEVKHINKNIRENILTPYKGKVAFLEEGFTEEKLKDILHSSSDITVVKGDYRLFNLVDGNEIKFGSKNQFSLYFSKSPNDKLYDLFSDRINWDFLTTNKIESESELFSREIEIDKTKYNFSSTCNLALWYKALKTGRNKVHMQEICGVDRKKIAQSFKKRSKEEWIELIETAIARVKSV